MTLILTTPWPVTIFSHYSTIILIGELLLLIIRIWDRFLAFPFGHTFVKRVRVPLRHGGEYGQRRFNSCR